MARGGSAVRAKLPNGEAGGLYRGVRQPTRSRGGRGGRLPRRGRRRRTEAGGGRRGEDRGEAAASLGECGVLIGWEAFSGG
jgi:hypothetical protein